MIACVRARGRFNDDKVAPEPNRLNAGEITRMLDESCANAYK